MRRMILVAALLVAGSHVASARNAAGSVGARNQGASHHAHAVERKGATSGGAIFVAPRSGPLRDVNGRVINLRTIPYEGLAPETVAALASKSSEQVYRGELCRVLSTHAEQRACLVPR